MNRCRYLIIFILFAQLLTGCEDWKLEGPEVYTFTINGTLNNTSEVITLGDTLHFEVRMPDTVRSSNGLGRVRTEPVNSVQISPSYVYSIYQIDTVNNRIYPLQDQPSYYDSYVNPGMLLSGPNSPYMQINTYPYRSVLHLIPKRKGIFYLEIREFAALFKINKNFEGKLTVNIDLPDKHLQLISKYLGADFLQYAAQRAARGYGTYAFRVD